MPAAARLAMTRASFGVLAVVAAGLTLGALAPAAGHALGAGGAGAQGAIGQGALRVTDWRGIALGAEARLILAHPDSDRLVAAALDELARLERIVSLYRRDSELSRLNAAGMLDAPSTELVELLALAGLVHDATGGVFDPSIQPLWAAYAAAGAEGRAPTDPERTAALARVGWEGVTVDPGRITLRPGMALTLNGIAQGYIVQSTILPVDAAALSRALGVPVTETVASRHQGTRNLLEHSLKKEERRSRSSNYWEELPCSSADLQL